MSVKSRCPNCGQTYKAVLPANCTRCLMAFAKLIRLEPVWKRAESPK